MHNTQVLIVGGGPVGLSLAAELGFNGITCELIEQGNGEILTPKMNEVNIRTMEFCRRWAVADKVLNCPFPADFPLDVAFVTRLFGYELGRLDRPPRAGQAPDPASPYRLQACSQHWFDPILRNLACSFPTVRLCYRQRLEKFELDNNGVTAEIANLSSGARKQIRADYMVGCDGANSQICETLGIKLEGKGTIGYPLHMFFQAPTLLAESGQKPATFYLLVDRDGFWGNLRIIEPQNGLWRLMADDSDGLQTAETVDRVSYLRRALGRDYPVTWVNTSIWKRRSVVAERYSKGRVFMAGDAIHQLSPTGALGMNSGVGDAVDLGWKLAAVLRGWGGHHLLDSYDAERRPIGTRNVRMATNFYVNADAFKQVGATIEDDSAEGAAARGALGQILVCDLGREFRTLGLQIGYRYLDSPICVPDDSPPPPDEPDVYVPSTWPGARAPHAWLGEGRSTLDLFGKHFALLRFAGAPSTDALEVAATDRGVPLRVFCVTDSVTAELYGRRLVLVRPDGHVAWRGDTMPEDALAVIDRVRGAGRINDAV